MESPTSPAVLSLQETTKSFSGLQRQGDSPFAFAILDVLAVKVGAAPAVLDTQATGNMLRGQRQQGDSLPTRAGWTRVLVSALPAGLGARDSGKTLYGLQRQGKSLSAGALLCYACGEGGTAVDGAERTGHRHRGVWFAAAGR